MAAGTTIFDKQEFLDSLVEMGYEPTEKGFKKCIKKEIKKHKLAVLAKMLNISTMSIRTRMREFGIKSPYSPGGNNNPGGKYGKHGKCRSVRDGYLYREEKNGSSM